MTINKAVDGVVEFLKELTALGLNYYISVLIFAVCLTAALVMLFLSVVFCKPKGSLIGLFVFYEICFFISALLCLSESVYSGKVFKNVVSAYFFCLAEFGVCLAFVFALHVQRRTLNKRFKRVEKDKNRAIAPKTAFWGGVCDFKPQELSGMEELKEKDKTVDEPLNESRIPAINTAGDLSKDFTCDSPNSVIVGAFERRDIPDINVNYLSGLVSELLKKSLSDEDRQEMEDLKFRLKRLPRTSEEVESLNSKLGLLLKRVADYGIEP